MSWSSGIQSFKAEIQHLRRLCQKPKEQEEPWAWYVLRPISIYLTWGLGRTSVTANHVTVAMLLSSILSSVLLAFGGIWSLLGALGLQFTYLLDCVDGELARLKGASSRVGQHLDYLSHYTMAITIPLGVAIRLSTLPYGKVYLILGMLLAVLFLLDNALGDLVYKVNFSTPEQMAKKDLHRQTTLYRLLGLYPVKGYVYKLLAFFILLLFVELTGLVFGSRWVEWLLILLLAGYTLAGVLNFGLRLRDLVVSGCVEERRWTANLGR